MSEQDVTWDALPPEQKAAFQQLLAEMDPDYRAAVAMQLPGGPYEVPVGPAVPIIPRPLCAACRWWLQDPEDGHQPPWGVCLRGAGTPPAPMAAVAEDGSGALLRTSPAFGCRAWEA